jgi:hydrogenase nickel incorporation protein HypA/HybF
MHEFSLATEVIKLAKREADQASAITIQEITIEVGYLSGVEADAFENALGFLSKDSVLDRSSIKIIKTSGKGKCNSCDYEFEMNHRMATCPKCRAFPSEVNGGDEFRVLSLVIEYPLPLKGGSGTAILS